MRFLRLLFAAGLVLWQRHKESEAFMVFQNFEDHIKTKCYGRDENNVELVNGQKFPVPNAVEAFTSIVEKIENIYPTWRPDVVIQNILLSARYDDLEFIPPAPGTSDRGSFRTRGGSDVSTGYEILNHLLGYPTNPDIKEKDLTEDELCALYYMLSHTVNETALTADARMKDIGGQKVLENPREQGVVSLGSRTRHAFALGKVLLGLLAGLRGQQEINAAEIFTRLKSTQAPPNQLNGIKVNVLYGATFGGIISVTKKNVMAAKAPNFEGQYFLPNGFWQDAVCTTHYVLDDNNKCHATYALLRGALDGYVLGLKIKDLMSTIKNLRLSQILRLYYSASGFPEVPELSWCNRRSEFKKVSNEIRMSALNYDKLYTALIGSSIEDQTINANLDLVFKNIEEMEGQIFDEAAREAAECSGLDPRRNRYCETPADYFAVLDFRAQGDNRDVQYQILGNLTVGFDIRPNGGSLSVFTNLKPPGSEFDLDTIVNGSEVSGCASCGALHYRPLRSNTESETEIMRDLNRTLGQQQEDEEERQKQGVPAKVLLYFNYGNPVSDSLLREAIWEIHRRNRLTEFLVFGSKRDALKIFSRSETDVETSNNVQAFMPKLKEKVCKVPAQFQFENCYRRSDDEERLHVYEGYVSHNGIQYWAMDPKYFLKSFNIKMTFKARTGQIRVCFSRDERDFTEARDPPPGYCKESSASGGEAIFYESNPCHKYKQYNCRPFFFSVEGKAAPTEPCSDQRCVSPNQIQFEFTHEGISCNVAASLASSWILAVLLIVTKLIVLQN